MDDKKQPPKGQPVAQKGPVPAVRTASRHRFAAGETAIMPLAEILRSRDSKALSDPGLSGTLPPEWRRARQDLEAALENATPQESLASGGDTQIASGFTHLHTSATAVPKGPEARQKTETLKEPEKKAPVAVRTSNLAADAIAPPGRGKPQAKVRSQVIVFFSCKGGSGATVLSLNAAHTYARNKMNCCLVDLDLQMGDDLAALALKPKLTLAQAAAGATAGDRLQRDRLPMHHSSLSVLSQVGSLDDLDTVSSESMAKLVETLRETFDVIVLDGVHEFSDNVLAVLDVADKICLVAVQEVLSIRRARWSFNILRKIGFDPKDITVVVNQFDPRSEVPLASMSSIFEPAQIMTVVNDPLVVLQSLNRGVPLQETSANRPVTRQIRRLANSLIGIVVTEEPEESEQPQGSMLKRMLRKFK